MIEFTKMHGLGNDYIYINNLEGKNQIANVPAFTRYISDRHFGVGSDGVILLKESDIADLKMEIYNADGSQAQMCGNGIRCFGKYAYEAGIVTKKQLEIETLSGIKKLYLNVENEAVTQVTVNMGKAKWNDTILPKENVNEFKVLEWKIQGTAVSMGNPHFVIFTSNIDDIDIEKYGPVIENYPIFPEKTNVEFIEVQGNDSIKMRVWERGSGETFACGTGACASFAVCNKKGLIKNSAKVYLKGGCLDIKLDEKTDEIYMTGLATKVCDGKIDESVIESSK